MQRLKQFNTAHPMIMPALVGTLFYVLFGLVLWWCLDRYIQPSSSTEKRDLVQALGLIMAGVAGGVGIYFTWRNQRLTQESLQSTRKSTEENLRLTREGQLTERFTRAIDQLGASDDEGNKRLEIRLGGIYALERIARDSPIDYGPVMEVLTAYVRKNAPSTPKISEADEAVDQIMTPDLPGPHTRASTIFDAVPEDLPADVQAILDVIGRRKKDHVPAENRIGYLDLGWADLPGASLSPGADLSGVNIFQTNLEGAVLSEVDLRESLIMETDLSGADLYGANLSEADLSGADLSKAYLSGANLSGAKGLVQEQLVWVLIDEDTLLPEDLAKSKASTDGDENKQTEDDE